MNIEDRKLEAKKLIGKMNRAFGKGDIYSYFVAGAIPLYDFIKTVSCHNKLVSSGHFSTKKAYVITMKPNIVTKTIKGREYTGFRFTCWSGHTVER